jgi:hypothetical protein
MLAVDWRGRTVRIYILQFAMPPDVTIFFHVNVVSCATKNDDAPDWRAITECLINVFL